MIIFPVSVEFSEYLNCEENGSLFLNPDELQSEFG